MRCLWRTHFNIEIGEGGVLANMCLIKRAFFSHIPVLIFVVLHCNQGITVIGSSRADRCACEFHVALPGLHNSPVENSTAMQIIVLVRTRMHRNQESCFPLENSPVENYFVQWKTQWKTSGKLQWKSQIPCGFVLWEGVAT